MRLVVVPLLRIHQKICARQFQASVRGWFVENDLGLGGVNHSPANQFHVNEVEPHGSLVGSAHAAKTKGISFSLSLRNIMEAVGRVPNNLDKRDLVGFLLGGCFLLRLRRVRSNETKPKKSQKIRVA